MVGSAKLLEQLLEEVLVECGRNGALDAELSLRAVCAPADTGVDDVGGVGDLDAAAARLRELPSELIRDVIQILTMRFHLRNKAEQLEIASINRERERRATPESPRAESVAEAVGTLAKEGASLADLVRTIEQLDIGPTLTAHPTEARRRAVLRKQGALAISLDRLDDDRLTPAGRASETDAMRRTLVELAMTDEVRSERLDAMDEVRNGLHYLTGSIWRAVPRLHDDLDRAVRQTYGAERIEPTTPLRYRSWIGGDRDGNPRVTPEVTRQAITAQRQAAVRLYLDELATLRQHLTVSQRRRPASDELLAAIERDLDPDGDTRHIQHEPYRQRIDQMSARVQRVADDPGAYTASAFMLDLTMIQASLEQSGLPRLASGGPLRDLMVRVGAFGFRLASLDLRQHSEVIGAAVDELLREAGVCEAYRELDEAARLEVLRQELATARPLTPIGAELSEATRAVLDTFCVASEALAHDPRAIGTYIVSMTHEVSHILEPLMLSREFGLYRPARGGSPGHSALDVAPLFETIDDLKRAAGLLDKLFAEPIYRAHLERRSGLQEVMLGYSDSNKDGGYWVANWLLHRSQAEICEACARAGVEPRLFHGRGGAIGRGGGRANEAILAAPRASRTGRIRFTEQGEIISFRYALPAIAHRHLEQILNAMLIATGRSTTGADETPTGAPDVMDAMSRDSMRAYRSLIDDEAFWPWYMSTTPIAHISRLPLASRPVMRSPGVADFSRLRAIPWGFAWTQIRATAPGWYGVGMAIERAKASDPGITERMRDWIGDWSFFRTVLRNAEQELARARLPISDRYSRAAGFNADEEILARIRDEHDRTRSLILEITGQTRLLEGRPVIRRLIDARNPDTDVLNLCQIELMRRWRDGGEGDPTIGAALLSSLNAIAAAMQSTG